MTAQKPVDLDEIEALVAGATPGPWGLQQFEAYDPGDMMVVAGFGDLWIVNVGCEVRDFPSDVNPQELANGQCIVALRNAAPAILSELRAARAVVAALSSAIVQKDGPTWWCCVCGGRGGLVDGPPTEVEHYVDCDYVAALGRAGQ